MSVWGNVCLGRLCSGGLSRGCLPRGVCLRVCAGGVSTQRGSACGVSAWGGGVCPEGVHLTPLWTEFLTHACENIIFPQLRLRKVIMSTDQNKTEKCSPQAVCCSFGVCVTPSQGLSALQSVASPAVALMVFPVHCVQVSFVLKYPAMHSTKRMC